jgi:hypothetical protein
VTIVKNLMLQHASTLNSEVKGVDRSAGGHKCSYAASAFPAADPLPSEKESAMCSIS